MTTIPTEWSATCSSCGTTIYYKNRASQRVAEWRGNIRCKACGNKERIRAKWTKHTNTPWFRNCPKCEKVLFYSSAHNRDMAVAKNSTCMECKNNFTPEYREKLSRANKGKFYPHKPRSKNTTSGKFSKKCPNCNCDMFYSRKDKLKMSLENNWVCNSCSSYVHKKAWKHVITQEHIDKMAATKAGYATVEEYLEDYPKKKAYKRKVYYVTRQQDLSKLPNFDKLRGRCGMQDAYQLDHIISIDEGYQKGIAPEVIGNISNLRFIPWRDNLLKSRSQLGFVEWLATLGIPYQVGTSSVVEFPQQKLAIDYVEVERRGEFYGNQYRRDPERLIDSYAQRGMRLLIVWDVEWQLRPAVIQHKIMHILGVRTHVPCIGGRQVQVQEISSATAKVFLEQYHNQGWSSAQIYYGAETSAGELVAVMSFSVSRGGMGKGTSQTGEYELVRYATHSGYRCPGIASKLFRHFCTIYTPAKVFSFASTRYSISDSNMYVNLGFEFKGRLNPSYMYAKDGILRHRSKFMKKNLVANGADPNLTETEIMRTSGWERIWEPGHLRYECNPVLR